MEVINNAGFSQEELDLYVKQEIEFRANDPKYKLGIQSIEIDLDGEDVVIKTKPVPNIKRVRRITGYLSYDDRFNTAKKAELNARLAHG